jgi:hypothetical protein
MRPSVVRRAKWAWKGLTPFVPFGVKWAWKGLTPASSFGVIPAMVGGVSRGIGVH